MSGNRVHAVRMKKELSRNRKYTGGVGFISGKTPFYTLNLRKEKVQIAESLS